MTEESSTRCTAFLGNRRIASGDVRTVALAARAAWKRETTVPLLIFDDDTSRLIEIDLRGSEQEVVARLRQAKPRGPGRPKLGVVSKEVTLLPRHWAWLGTQRGGASATLRRLVDQARKNQEGSDHIRRAQDAAYRFMTAMAGDLPGFEEAIRALFASDRERFEEQIAGWPGDLAEHGRMLAARAWVLRANPTASTGGG